MANSFSKVEMIFWEKVIEGFNNSNLFAKNVSQYHPSAGAVERSGATIRLPLAYQAETATGLDVSASYKDVIDLSVAISLADADIKNAPFTLTAHERNDPMRLQRQADAAVRKVSSDIDSQVKSTVVTRGALVGAATGDLTNYDDLAKADSMLREVECGPENQLMALPPRIANKIANELAGRGTVSGSVKTAYERALLPSIAGFETLRTNVTSQVAADSISGITINGANQDKDPIAYNSDGGYGADEIDDIRYQTITMAGTGNSPANGSCFTIAGVNRVGIDTKQDSGQLQTFRVISGGGTTTPTISPAIVVSGPYQNCSAIPANGAAVTVINTDNANPVAFWTESSVVLFKSDLDVDDMGDNVAVTSETTDSGITLIFARQGSIDDLSAKYRVTCWNRAHVVEPLKCGIILPGQNAAI